MAQKIDPKDFEKVMKETLGLIPGKVQKVIDKQSLAVAKEAAETLKRTSPRENVRGGGKYAESWDVRSDASNKVQGVLRWVRNKEHYRLTHLLEFGYVHHRTGRRTGRRVHIEPVNDWLIKEFPKRVADTVSDEL